MRIVSFPPHVGIMFKAGKWVLQGGLRPEPARTKVSNLPSFSTTTKHVFLYQLQKVGSSIGFLDTGVGIYKIVIAKSWFQHQNAEYLDIWVFGYALMVPVRSTAWTLYILGLEAISNFGLMSDSVPVLVQQS